MLFGNKNAQDAILKKAKEVAEKRGFKIVYGAVMGSISRGIASYESDCDLRFLYVADGFPQKRYFPKECEEKDVVYRYFTREDCTSHIEISHIFDRIAFWELSSFLAYLVEPVIGKETWDANGLYYIVEHTFLSPYTWDPYGIQQMIVPYINILRKEEYEKAYMKALILKRHSDRDVVAMKHYLDAIWASLSIWWIDTYHTASPVSIHTLLAAFPDEMFRRKINILIDETYEKCKQYYIENGNGYRATARENVFMKKDEDIDRFIQTNFKSADKVSAVSKEQQYALVAQLCQAVGKHLCANKIAKMNEYDVSG